MEQSGNSDVSGEHLGLILGIFLGGAGIRGEQVLERFRKTPHGDCTPGTCCATDANVLAEESEVSMTEVLGLFEGISKGILELGAVEAESAVFRLSVSEPNT